MTTSCSQSLLVNLKYHRYRLQIYTVNIYWSGKTGGKKERWGNLETIIYFVLFKALNTTNIRGGNRREKRSERVLLQIFFPVSSLQL